MLSNIFHDFICKSVVLDNSTMLRLALPSLNRVRSLRFVFLGKGKQTAENDTKYSNIPNCKISSHLLTQHGFFKNSLRVRSRSTQLS